MRFTVNFTIRGNYENFYEKYRRTVIHNIFDYSVDVQLIAKYGKYSRDDKLSTVKQSYKMIFDVCELETRTYRP